ncbi:MAG TPA: cell envelope integrity protein CreD [Puia sp.]|nr:cell envelope integrity protein CreD [Puia sp.]
MENKAGFWNHFRILFKSAVIGALILLLLIPTALIQNLVSERQQRQQDAVSEIDSHWAGSQAITGPVIGIPYFDSVADNGADQRVRRWAYFLPDQLDIRSHLVPEKRYRGIYQVVVYVAEIDLQGSYHGLHLQELGLTPGNMLWKEATVFFDISDIQGLNDDLVIHWRSTDAASHSTDLTLATAKISTDQFKNALTAPLPQWSAPADANADPFKDVQFSSTIRIKGSGNLLFVPGARDTRVSATSSWSNPSFTGSSLPDLRTVRDSGFIADWKVLALHGKFPQQWKRNAYDLSSSAFGVALMVPVDVYQQTTRSVKYAILVILLTFTAFLLMEWVYDLAIHALQYALVGFALCIFYTLLLSLAEYMAFALAYMTAAIATIALISWYAGSALHSAKTAFFMAFLLSVQYGFIYILIQSQDYALLMGSIGLFVILGVVMYFSRKIKWEKAAADR